MALIPCPECEKKISERAPHCPHCGCPVAKTEAPKEKKELGGCLMAFLILEVASRGLMIILYTFFMDRFTNSRIRHPEWEPIVTFLAFAAITISCIGIWNWKRWGPVLYLASEGVLCLYVLLFVSIPGALICLIWPGIFLALIQPVWKHMDDGSPQAASPSGKASSDDSFCTNCGEKKRPGAKSCPNCWEDY